MKISNLIENVIHADFKNNKSKSNMSTGANVKSLRPDGQTAKDVGLDIPKGYERFELRSKEGSNVATIVGIKNDKEFVVSSGHLVLMKALLPLYNGGQTNSDLKPVSMVEAFGSSWMNAVHKLKGFTLVEKPMYFEDLDKKTISELEIKRLEKDLGKLKVMSVKDVYGYQISKPLDSVKQMPSEDTFILQMGDGTKYLVDTTQANTYIRMWMKIA